MSDVSADVAKVTPIWRSAPMISGYLLTLFFLAGLLASLFALPFCKGAGPCLSNWNYITYLGSPNEIGDTLAGFAGALAFVWLVVTVWLQATELREQREEIAKMATAQEKQVELLRKQGEIFLLEQQQRLETMATQTYRDAAANIARCFAAADLNYVNWYLLDQKKSEQRRERFLKHGFTRHEAERPEGVLDCLNELFGNGIRKLQAVPEERFAQKPNYPEDLHQLRKYLAILVECKNGLPAAYSERVFEMKLDTALQYLDDLLSGSYWDSSLENL